MPRPGADAQASAVRGGDRAAPTRGCRPRCSSPGVQRPVRDRVAGNVLGDVCMGSIDFALNAASDSVRSWSISHSGCGACPGGRRYLSPIKFWSRTVSPMLRSFTQRIFVAVRESATGCRNVWGAGGARDAGLPGGPDRVGRRINAAQSASTSARRWSAPPVGDRRVLRRPQIARTRSACRSIPGPSAPTTRPARPRPATRGNSTSWRSRWPRSSSRAAARSPARRRPKPATASASVPSLRRGRPRPGLRPAAGHAQSPPSPGDPRAGLGNPRISGARPGKLDSDREA